MLVQPAAPPPPQPVPVPVAAVPVAGMTLFAPVMQPAARGVEEQTTQAVVAVVQRPGCL